MLSLADRRSQAGPERAMDAFHSVTRIIIWVIQGGGVLVIGLGCVASTGRFLMRLRRVQGMEAYQEFRRNLGRSIIIGLEFLIAGDMISTVIISPTLSSAGVLGIIVLIRAFLSMTLDVTIEGEWPWRLSSGTGE